MTGCTGMGSDAAEAVLCMYPTPRSLFEAYRAVRKVADERNVNAVICATKANPSQQLYLGSVQTYLCGGISQQPSSRVCRRKHCALAWTSLAVAWLSD